MEKGFKNLNLAYMNFQKKGTYEEDPLDSGIGMSDTGLELDSAAEKFPPMTTYASQSRTRVPYIRDMLQYAEPNSHPPKDEPGTNRTTSSQRAISVENIMAQSRSDHGSADLEVDMASKEKEKQLPELQPTKELLLERLMVYFHEIFHSVDFSYW